MKHVSFFAITVVLLATGLRLQGQCASPKTIEDGVQLYQRPGIAAATPSFWDEFKSMFNFWNPPPTLPFQRSIGFLVGVSDYKNPGFKKLPGVENDLDDMCRYLLSKGGFDLVYVARGPAATPKTINYYMMDFFHDARNLGANDRLLFYFSGHGADDEGGDPYLLFGGASPGNFGDEQVLPVDSWEKWSNRVPAKHALFIFDACVAGEAMPKSNGETEKERAQGLLATLSGDGSRTVVTAGTLDQATWYANEKSLGYSVFTNSLLAVLQSDQSGPLMSIDEAVEKAAQITAAYTHDRKVAPAIPDVRRYETSKRSGRFAFLNPNANDRSLPEALKGALTNKGASAPSSEPETVRALEMTTELTRVQDDPALSLYLGTRAMELSEDSPPPNLIYSVVKSLNRGASYARFHAGTFPDGIAWSPDGKTLAFASNGNAISLWNSDTEGVIRTLYGHSDYVQSVAWSPDGKTLASASSDKTIRLWNLGTGEATRTLSGHSDYVQSVAWSPDGKTLASASSDKTIRLWNPETGETIRILAGHSDSVWSIAWSPDGKTLASASSDKTIRLWNPDTGETIRILAGNTDSVLSVSWSPDGKALASASNDKTIRLWNPSTGETIRTFAGHSAPVLSVAWSPDGKTLASASSDKTIRLWNPSTGETIRTFVGHSAAVIRVAWSPDGKALASASNDWTIRLWNPEAGETIRTLSGHSDSVLSVAWSPDGNALASASNDKTIRLWNPSTGETIRTLSANPGPVLSVAWSPDGKTLASASHNTISLWNPETGAIIRTFVWNRATRVFSIAWSPDGKTLASASDDGTIRLWNPESGNTIRTLSGHFDFVWSVAWSPNGKTLASASADSTIRLWNPETGETIRILHGRSGVKSLAWSPDGKTLASTSHDGTIRLWNPDTGESIRTLVSEPDFLGGPPEMLSVAWSPDGNTLASGSIGNTIHLWNPDTGESICAHTGHFGQVLSVAWNPDGRTLASASQDKTIRLWPGSSDELLKQAKEAIRLYSPTPAECLTYFSSESCPLLR